MTAEQLERIIETTWGKIHSDCLKHSQLKLTAEQMEPDHKAFHDLESLVEGSGYVKAVEINCKMAMILRVLGIHDVIITTVLAGIAIGKAISEFESLEQLHSIER